MHGSRESRTRCNVQPVNPYPGSNPKRGRRPNMELTITKDTAELERLEGIIRRGIVSFLNVAEALIQIRDKQYYKKVLGFETFGEYCETKWNMTRQRAYQLIDAKQVADTLSNNLTKEEVEEIPATQLCTLKEVPPEDRSTIYHLAKETAPAGKLTAAHVEKTVREIRGIHPVPKPIENQADLVQKIINLIDTIEDGNPRCKEALARIALHVWNRQHGIKAA